MKERLHKTAVARSKTTTTTTTTTTKTTTKTTKTTTTTTNTTKTKWSSMSKNNGNHKNKKQKGERDSNAKDYLSLFRNFIITSDNRAEAMDETEKDEEKDEMGDDKGDKKVHLKQFFVGGICNSSLLCGLCDDIVQLPLKCQDCNYTYCGMCFASHYCLETWSSTPETTATDLSYVESEKELMNQMVHCPTYCGWCGKAANYEYHNRNHCLGLLLDETNSVGHLYQQEQQEVTTSTRAQEFTIEVKKIFETEPPKKISERLNELRKPDISMNSRLRQLRDASTSKVDVEDIKKGSIDEEEFAKDFIQNKCGDIEELSNSPSDKGDDLSGGTHQTFGTLQWFAIMRWVFSWSIAMFGNCDIYAIDFGAGLNLPSIIAAMAFPMMLWTGVEIDLIRIMLGCSLYLRFISFWNFDRRLPPVGYISGDCANHINVFGTNVAFCWDSKLLKVLIVLLVLLLCLITNYMCLQGLSTISV